MMENLYRIIYGILLVIVVLDPCILGKDKKPCTLEHRLHGDPSCLYSDGDMELTKDKYDVLFGHKTTKGKDYQPATLWPNGVIPYEFASGDFTDDEVFRVHEAMSLWEFGTCLRFRPATRKDKNKIRFEDGRGCTSPLGMSQGVTKITLNKVKCRNRGVYLHELGHALGMVHTHQRPDRDLYITIERDFMTKRGKVEMDKPYVADKLNLHGIPYDLSSIMHFDEKAYSKDGLHKTITTSDQSKQHLIQSYVFKWLSFYDVKLANLMYQCNKKCPNDRKCKAPGYLNKDCKCICPNGMNCGYGVLECPTDYQDPKCDEWYKRGDCDTHIGKYDMRLYCPRRCNCVNKWDDAHCQKEAAAGKCTTNKGYMEARCEASCNLCKKERPATPGCPRFELGALSNLKIPTTLAPTTTTSAPPKTTSTSRACKDKAAYQRCKGLADRGDCKTSSWMRINCPTFCKTCPGTCVNLWNLTECERLKSLGRCKNSTAWMNRNCWKTCNGCGVQEDCKDIHQSCQGWAEAGYCKTSSTTRTNCNKSCGIC